jgi:hypothetical protein
MFLEIFIELCGISNQHYVNVSSLSCFSSDCCGVEMVFDRHSSSLNDSNSAMFLENFDANYAGFLINCTCASFCSSVPMTAFGRLPRSSLIISNVR